IKVPPLGESVTEATVAKWLKKAGDAAKMGDLLLELETEKVTLEINAPVTGVLSEIKIKEGATVKVGDILGVMNEEGAAPAEPEKPKPEPEPQSTPQPAEKTKDEKEKLSPAVRKLVDEKDIEVEKIQGTGKDGRIIKEDVLAYQPTPTKANGET